MTPAAIKILAKIREAGRLADSAKGRSLTKRHADKFPAWRARQEWSEGYREALRQAGQP